MSKQITKSHIGKRLLLTDGYTRVEREEVIPIEISPSGEQVKLRSVDRGNTWWQDNDEWTTVILEELP